MQKEEGIKAKSGCPATDYNWHAARKKPYVMCLGHKSQSRVSELLTDGNFFQSIRHRFYAFLDPF